MDDQRAVTLRESVAALTTREAEVLRCLANGGSNKEIARELGVSVHTVETHLSNLYAKLGCRGRADAILVAVEAFRR